MFYRPSVRKKPIGCWKIIASISSVMVLGFGPLPSRRRTSSLDLYRHSRRPSPPASNRLAFGCTFLEPTACNGGSGGGAAVRTLNSGHWRSCLLHVRPQPSVAAGDGEDRHDPRHRG